MVKQWHTKRHKGSCRGVEFSPDGESIVSVGKDLVIKIANCETGKVTAKDMQAHSYEHPFSVLIAGLHLMR
jgi:WD40 repeat protein